LEYSRISSARQQTVWSGIRFSSETQDLVSNKALKVSENRHLHCNECDYMAISESKLKMHMRTHTGEKPYVCLYCPYRSSQSSNLRKHIQLRHALIPD